MTTQTLVQAISLQKISSVRLPRINWRVLLFFSFCAVLACAVLYVVQINGMMAGGYLIKSYQKQIDNLITENKNLELNLAQISYLENMQKRAKEMSFSRVQTMKYIQVLDSSLAKR